MYKVKSIALVGLILLVISLLFYLSTFFNYSYGSAELERKNYEKFLKEHPFNNRTQSYKELQEIPRQDRPDLAWEQNYLATMNPALGRPETEKLFPIFKRTKEMQNALKALPGSAGSPWLERGPDNVGGRTRAIAWDPTVTNKVWAGSVTGGLWFNNNITNAAFSWQSVNDFWDNIAVTAIAFDPNNASIIYVGTGEGWLSASTRGAGIWKSTDGGASFSQLSSTQDFFYINDIVVRNESGNSVVYAGVDVVLYQGLFHGNSEGLQRSTDGGTSWSQVLPSVGTGPETPTDLEIGADNELWVGVGINSFLQGGGQIYSSTSGTTFNLRYTHHTPGRVNIACAPSDANYIYAAFEVDSELDDFRQSTNDGNSWTSKTEPEDIDLDIPITDFSRGQAWYDLTLAVDPNDRNTVMIGGINLFKTINGGDAWAQVSKWSNNPNMNLLNASLVHADHHAIVYKDGSSSEVLFGNDGGVYYSATANNTPPVFTISPRVNDYNVTQYYACAMHPDAGTSIFLAGSQDNGTQRYTMAGINSTTEASGGDGGFCHIDQTNPNYQTTSFVRNVIFHSSNGGNFFDPSGILDDQTTGRFINPSDLDDNQNILYTYSVTDSLYRISNFESSSPFVERISITDLGSDASHLRVSPYTTNSTTLFVGTEAGRLFKISTADGAPNSTEITGFSFPVGSVSCIEFGQNEDEILVTFSNYDVTSIWYTTNGGVSWSSKEGDLPDMPIRWALFNPLNYDEVILATEVGVWGTSNFNVASPNWNVSNSGLANVRVDMLQLRSSDNQVIAATHGRGLFSSFGFNPTGSGITWTNQPTDITIGCNDSSLPVHVGIASAITTCATGGLAISFTDIVVAGACIHDSTITRTWRATDNCGNDISFSQVITIQDNTPPTISCLSTQNQLTVNGTDTLLRDYTMLVIATDNCDGIQAITITQSPAAGSTQTVGAVNVILTASDICGNTSSCNFDVLIGFANSIQENTMNGVTVHPNPTNGLFSIIFDREISNTAVTIYNLLGEVVYKEEITNRISSVDLQHVKKGTYYVYIEEDTLSTIKKVLLF